MKKQMTPQECKAWAMFQKLRQVYTPDEILAIAQDKKMNHDICLGKRVDLGITLIQLMLYWEVSDEDLRDFITKHDEFVKAYDRNAPEDREEFTELLKELKIRTGYDILTGEIDDGRTDESETSLG